MLIGIFILVVAILALVGCDFDTPSDTFTSEEYFDFTYLEDSDSYSIRAKDTSNLPSEISLPSTYNGKPVTLICENAFSGCIDLTKVVIPDSVTTIEKSAFYYCRNLRKVVIGEAVTSIGGWAFCGCEKISNVIVPDSLEYLGYSAFEYDIVGTKYKGHIYLGTKDNPYKIVVGTTYLSSIIDLAFPPQKITLHENTRIIVPYGVPIHKEISSVNIPSKVYLIYEEAFQYYKVGSDNYIETITVDSRNPYYYSQGNCLIEKETGTLVLGCKNSEVPDNITAIGEWAFARCHNLTDVTIPDSVNAICEYSFVVCDSLTSVVISDSVTFIGSGAFNGCDNLTDVYYTGTEEEWNAIDIGDWNENLTSATIHFNYVPEE